MLSMASCFLSHPRTETWRDPGRRPAKGSSTGQSQGQTDPAAPAVAMPSDWLM